MDQFRMTTLSSKTARLKLKPRGKPFWRESLGYRRLKDAAGSWAVRHYVGGQKYEIERLGTADDLADADGKTILTYAQATKRAAERKAERGETKEGTTAETVSVRQAVVAYISKRDKRESNRKGRPVHSDASRLRRHLLGQEARGKQPAIEAAKLAAIPLHRLADADLKRWRDGLPGMLKGTSRKRTTNDLKAALNDFYRDNKAGLPATLPATIKDGLRVETDDDAEPVARDNQILTDAEVGRLIRAAREVDATEHWDGDLYRLVLLLAATGARFSQIVRMTVADCQPKHGRVHVPFSRKGKNRTAGTAAVPVGQDVLDALYAATVGRNGSGRLLERWRHRQVPGRVGEWERDARGPWQAASEMPWDAIRKQAEMPAVIPYALRHSSIVRGIRQNLPLRLVAALHDTSVVMIERHYSRYIVDGLEELAARAVVPLVPDDDATATLVPLRR